MPDPNEKKDELEEKQEDNTEEKEEEFLSPGVSGPSKGVLEKITSIFKKKPTSDEEVNEDETKDADEADETDKTDDTTEGKEATEEKEDEFKYEEIDPKFIEVARKYGWQDNRIVEYAEKHSEEDLLVMGNLMQDSIAKSVSKDEDVDESSDEFNKDELLKLAGDDPKLIALIEKVISPLAKRVADTSSKSTEFSEELSKREQDDALKEELRNVEVANSVFDKSDISALGKTEDIPRLPDGAFVPNDPVFRERSKIWDVAQMFYAKGGTFKDSMKNAIQWYKGENVEKDVKKKVIKDLKNQEERVMPKRNESKVEKTYATEEERKAAIINDAVSKYNIEFPA